MSSVSAAVTSASNAPTGSVAAAAAMHVLNKSLDIQAAGAMTLLNALPAQPALATSGSVGTQVNTYA